MARAPTAQDYHHFDDLRDYILANPSKDVGPVTQDPYETKILIYGQETERQIQDYTVTVPQAVERLFLEVLSNAGDNVDRSRRIGLDPGEIQVNVTRGTVQVVNGGAPIPIEVHPTFGVYVPELIFGQLHSGSNFDKSKARTGAGVNGLGVKLCNVFSHWMIVQVGDPNHGLSYEQAWEQHMKVRHEPVIQPYNGPAYVSVTYHLDFPYFDYANPNDSQTDGGYPDEAFFLFARHCADASFTSKVSVTYNGELFDYRKAQDYARLYCPQLEKNQMVLHREYPDDGVDRAEGTDKTGRTDRKQVPSIELLAMNTPDAAICISFVNGIMTLDGGVHVNAAYKALSQGLIETINGLGERRKAKNRKVEEPTKGKRRPGLTQADVKAHLSIILSVRLEDPIFPSQTKNILSRPTPKFNIQPATLKALTKWSLVYRLQAALEAKQFKVLTKTDGKKSRRVAIDKATEANWAGKAKSHLCTLCLTEGDSAEAYAKARADLYEDGYNYFGFFPMRGKPLNVMNASPLKIADNDEIVAIKSLLGLKEGVDYTDERNFRTLRYGSVLIMADADDDGKHILGLVLNIFYCRFPSLLQREFVKFLRTPIIRVWKGRTTHKFFTETEYQQWRQQTAQAHTWQKKYFKGLASSKPSDVADDFNDARTVVCLYDDLTPDYMRLAFDDHFTHHRKEWITNHQRILGPLNLERQPISAFIDQELIDHAIANVIRSIPRMLDGLKVSQRKVLWTAFEKWRGKMNSKAPEAKVATFGAKVSSKTAYKHGEKSLFDCIIGMTQSFVGSNNMPYFTEEGQFGTRTKGGKDAGSPRYIYIKPQWWLPYIFKESDLPILDRIEEEGDALEPRTFLPIIPMALVNGCNGIGTGWSVFIPNHNPLDLCAWLQARINRDLEPSSALPAIMPWYRGYEGEISLQAMGSTARSKKPDESGDETTRSGDPMNPDPDPEDPLGEDEVALESSRVSMVTQGHYHYQGDRLIITELPIGRWTKDYSNFLNRLIDQKVIKDVQNKSKTNRVHFELIGFDRPKTNPTQRLRLRRTFGMSNMVLLDNDNRPVRYGSSDEVLESFYQLRLPYYQKRKDYVLAQLEKRIASLDQKMRFIQAVIQERLILYRDRKPVPRDQVLSQMQQLGLEPELLKTTNFHQITEERVHDLAQEIEKLSRERDQYRATSIQQLWLQDLEDFVRAYQRQASNSGSKKA